MKADKSDTYTKTEINNSLLLKSNVSDNYNKGEIDSKLLLKNNVADNYIKTEIDSKLLLKSNVSDNYNKTEIDNKLLLKSNSSDVYVKSETDTQISTAIANLVNTAPSTLDTLNEIAVALGNDPNFSTTITNLIAAKAPISSPSFTWDISFSGATGITGLNKTHVGLSSVDNTSDLNKPISTATQTALNAKAPLASPTFTGTVLGITKSMVGLSNVDNTTDIGKPISTATQSALDLKAPLAGPAFTGAVSFTGATAVTGLTKTTVGLANVDNTTDANKPISIATQAVLDLKAPLSGPSFSGSVSFTGATSVAGLTKTTVGLANVDNTSDANKPISIATQAVLDLKAPIGGPAFTGSVSFTGATSVTGLTKTTVGLANVDNTSDANKPISIVTQSALDLKAPLANPIFTGTVAG